MTERMTTGIERFFKMLPDGLCREVLHHYIHFLGEDGQIKRSKLDKTIPGKLYKRANPGERSTYGQVIYTFPDEDEPVLLLALATDYNEMGYGRNY